MPRYIAKTDGFLSDVCMHIKAGSTVEFAEGREPVIDLNNPFNWLVPENNFKPAEVLPTVGAIPVVAEEKPKVHEMEISRPAYDENMKIIVQAEKIEDGLIPPSPVVFDAPAVSPQVVTIPEAPVVEPVIDTTPIVPSEAPATPEGSGNQDVL